MKKEKFNKSENLMRTYFQMMEGKTIQEIADFLHLSTRTIYRYKVVIDKVSKEYPIV